MEKEALKRIFEFLEEKDKHNVPFKWKLINNEPLTKEDLNIKGDLDLYKTYINSLPEGLNVGNNLDLEFSYIESLPKDLKVNGNLKLYGCKHIQSLPEGLYVGRDLELQNSKIESLPEGLKVFMRLYIKHTPLEKYTDKEIREMVKPNGYVGHIIR